MSMEGPGEMEKIEAKRELPFVVDDSNPDIIKRREDNAPAKDKEISRDKVVETLGAGPESPEAREILNQFIGQLQESAGPDILRYNQDLVTFYLDLTEKNPVWRESLADALFDAGITAKQAGDEELKRRYFDQLTDSEYEERSY